MTAKQLRFESYVLGVLHSVALIQDEHKLPNVSNSLILELLETYDFKTLQEIAERYTIQIDFTTIQKQDKHV